MEKTTHSSNQGLGNWGEQQAAEYLEEKGYQILHRNVRTPYGEIDLLAQYEGVLVFVEVKTRSSQVYGNPEEAVDDRKITHMIESAEGFLQENPEFSQDWRLDVIAIVKRTEGPPEIIHFENAVNP
jgi:putative endonuclease